MEHVDNEGLAIQEIERVLRKEGYLCISVPHKGFFSVLDVENWRYHLRKVFDPKQKKGNPYYHTHYTVARLKALFSKHRICAMRRTGFLIFPLCLWTKRFFAKIGIDWFSKTLLSLEDIDAAVDYGKYAFNIMLLIKNEIDTHR